MNKINLAIQVLPFMEKNPYPIIDKVIEIISEMGFKYEVCPFETVVDCTWEQAFEIINPHYS